MWSVLYPFLLVGVHQQMLSTAHIVSLYKLQPIYPLFWAPGNRKADVSLSMLFSGPLTLLDFQKEKCCSSLEMC